MSNQTSKKQILEKAIAYLKSHNLCTMATANKTGSPHAACLEYANDGMDIYVSTWIGSRKVKNIQENPRVFYEVHDVVNINEDDIKNIKGLQVQAKAEILKYPSKEFKKAWDIMVKKYSIFKLMKLNEKRAVLHFIPEKFWMLDYSIKFGHMDEYEF